MPPTQRLITGTTHTTACPSERRRGPTHGRGIRSGFNAGRSRHEAPDDDAPGDVRLGRLAELGDLREACCPVRLECLRECPAWALSPAARRHAVCHRTGCSPAAGAACYVPC